uniref:Uncharacterized protein n=1 Tax=Cacopsylla melanoneura TaxID=428564 RepID=A0A8D8PMA1_9HEMI
MFSEHGWLCSSFFETISRYFPQTVNFTKKLAWHPFRKVDVFLAVFLDLKSLPPLIQHIFTWTYFSSLGACFAILLGNFLTWFAKVLQSRTKNLENTCFSYIFVYSISESKDSNLLPTSIIRLFIFKQTLKCKLINHL